MLNNKFVLFLQYVLPVFRCSHYIIIHLWIINCLLLQGNQR